MRARYEALVVACIPSLRRYARGLVSDPARADDLVQDTLERAWSRLSLWHRRGDMRAWMFGIMHNHFVDGVRARHSRPEDSVGDDLPELGQRETQSDLIEVGDLDRVLQRLPAQQREVLLLVTVEELSYTEAATVLGVPVGTVMSRLARARERLREELQGVTPDAGRQAGSPAAGPQAVPPISRIK